MQGTESELPSFFEPLFWELNYSSLDPEENNRTIVVRTINHGRWEHWQWLVNYYGKDNLGELISEIPVSEFRKPALNLISLLLGIERMKYASRSDYIQSKKSAN